MTDSPNLPMTRPGWYPDPSGTPGLRWWDGQSWTEYASVMPASLAPRPDIGRGVPVWNPLIGAIATLPVVYVVLIAFWNPVTRYIHVPGQSHPTLDPSGVFSPVLLLLPVAEFLVAGLSVLLAYFDWKQLGRDGVMRPFHWAWAFLGAPVYVIGRSVIFRKVAAGRGLGPVWISVGVIVLFLILYIPKWLALMSLVMSTSDMTT